MRTSLPNRIVALLFICFFYALSAVAASATTRRVPADYPTIQQAITVAINGDTVLVSPGTYRENINFLGKAITVISESGPEVTIIDGNRIGSVVTFNSGESSDSRLQGFTLRNGFSNMDSFQPSGAGISIIGASPSIIGNIVTGNQTHGLGAGISVSKPADAPVNPSPIIKENIIRANDACGAGGIAILAGSPLIQNNTINKNTTSICSGGFGGGGILIQSIPGAGEINAQILDNVISENVARFSNGAGGVSIGFTGGGTQLVRNNIITGNSGSAGGAMLVVYKSRVIQNLIIGNDAFQGGGIYADSGSGSLFLSNTISDNNAVQGSAIFAFGVNLHQFINNMIIAKVGQVSFYGAGPGQTPPLTFKNNDVYSFQGIAYGGSMPTQTGINGNLSADPLFVNPIAGDYHLRPSSPSIDRGDNTAPELPATDLDGKPRIQDDNHDGIPIVDTGVYEGPPPFDLCLQDESNGNLLQVNTSTGDYQFTNCAGLTVGGTGVLTKHGSQITLQHNAADRRVMASIDTSIKRATASVQLLSQGRTFSIADRNITNNTCACK